MKTRLACLLAALLLAAAARARAEAPASGKKQPLFIYWNPDFKLLVETQQQKRPRQQWVLDHIGVKPGMTVVDIGAGTGQLDYLLAARLKGTGRVYAADIEQRLVDYINDQARARGLQNLEGVRVSPEGVDPFYHSHKWDLIIIYDVDAFIHERARFYAGLTETLAPGGRLVIVGDPGGQYDFERADVLDWKGLVGAMESEPDDSPFKEGFAEPIAASLRGVTDVNQRAAVILFHLNRHLTSSFFSGLVDGYRFKPGVRLTDSEKPFANWLLHRLGLAGFPGKRNLAELLSIEMRDVVMLNKLMIIQRYRKYLRSDSPHPYLTAGFATAWYIQHDRNTADLRQAGMRVDRFFYLDPFQAVWVAVRK